MPHARPHVAIGIGFDDADLVLAIAADGRGNQKAQASRNGTGPGLRLIGMRERVSMAGGSLCITRRPPHGTRIRAALTISARHGAVAAWSG